MFSGVQSHSMISVQIHNAESEPPFWGLGAEPGYQDWTIESAALKYRPSWRLDGVSAAQHSSAVLISSFGAL
jgi:hypothetical protein